MATFPTVKFDWRTLTEARDAVVERAPMERGIPKQRRINSDVRVELDLMLYFDSISEADAFESWFDTDIHAGQDFFDFVHPRSGATVQARVVGGELGPLSFQQPTLEGCKRSLKVEYWKSTW